jgi:cyclophilin family peptidyl-prolyl cis-trans isomerase
MTMMTRSVVFALALLVSGFAARAAQQVEIRTSLGKIVVELDETASPKTCAAFLLYAHDHVYSDSNIFESDAKSISGGKPGPAARGYPASGNFVPSPPPSEFSLKHVRGAIGLGRTCGDCNPGRLTNSTRFYIIRTPAPQDDGQFAVFGHVVTGMDVVEQIADSLAKDKTRPVKIYGVSPVDSDSVTL